MSKILHCYIFCDSALQWQVTFYLLLLLWGPRELEVQLCATQSVEMLELLKNSHPYMASSARNGQNQLKY